MGSFNAANAAISSFLQSLPPWASVFIYIGIVFLSILIIRLIFRLVRHAVSRSKNSWDDKIFRAINLPVTLLVLAAAVALSSSIYSLPTRWERFISLFAKFLAIGAVALFLQRALTALQRRYVARERSLQTYSGVLRVLIFVVIYGTFFLIFLDTAGISITPLVASLGVGSIAVALALQETLASFFAGIYLVMDKPIRCGDFVKIESGEEGYVDSIGWRSVRIKMLPNNTVIIPNSKLSSSIITNYYYPERELAVLLQIGVDYSSDLELVERVTIDVGREVLQSVEGGVTNFEPFIRYHTFGDSSINFTVILRAQEFTNQFLIKHEFVKRLHRRYQKEGINIPFPIRTVHLKQPA